MKALGLVALGALLLVILFALAALLIMWLVNIVFNQYSIEPLLYTSSLAVTALLSILGAVIGNAVGGKSK